MEELNEIVPIGQKEIEDLIYTIRGQKVMLDSDLAKIKSEMVTNYFNIFGRR